MIALFKKEVSSFFSSIVGYITIIIFLLATSIFMWVIPGVTNVMDNGYATMEFLFINAPVLFLLLIPAITMRMFAEEKRLRTLELLMTKPLTNWDIILAKYLAGIVLVLFSLVPTFIYYYSIVQLGDPVGNIDFGGTIGSYIGLFFLAASFLSIGVFTSSLTSNQIVSFLLSLILCFFIYLGFDTLGDVFGNGKAGYFFKQLGIQEHYTSIQRGVIDSRDIIYFLSVIVFFLTLTYTGLLKRNW